MLDNCPTADPWLHVELLSVFESHGGQKRHQKLNGVFRFKCLRTLPRDFMIWKNKISFTSGFLHSREPTNDINILLKYTANFEEVFFFLREAGQRPGFH